MSSTAPTATTSEQRRLLRGRLGRGRFHPGWRQALADTAYILSGFALATAWWVLPVTLISLGAGMAVTLVGLPILAATLFLWTKIADTERWRARGLLGLEVASPYRRLGRVGAARRRGRHRLRSGDRGAAARPAPARRPALRADPTGARGALADGRGPQQQRHREEAVAHGRRRREAHQLDLRPAGAAPGDDENRRVRAVLTYLEGTRRP
jgi:hypothetical protein